MLKYLHTALERFAILGTTKKLNACLREESGTETKTPESTYARTQQTVMHVHRLAHVRNATNFIMKQPAVNIGIGIGIGTADLKANVIVYLQYRQIVV